MVKALSKSMDKREIYANKPLNSGNPYAQNTYFVAGNETPNFLYSLKAKSVTKTCVVSSPA